MSERFSVRVRYVLDGATRSLMDTGRAMAEVAALAVEIVAPELSWSSAVAQHADYGEVAEWEASHVVIFEGRSEDGAWRGRAESRLEAGGRGTKIGGAARIVIETARPNRRVTLTTPCDVSRWDVAGGPFTDATLDALRRAIEATVGRGSEATEPRRDPLDADAATLAEGADDEDIALWLGDLRDAGLDAERDEDRLVLTGAALDDPDALERARVTVGEIYAEGGHEDWNERALVALFAVGG